MKSVSCVIAFIIACVVSNAHAQVSAPQLETIHSHLEELRAKNKFLETIDNARRLQGEEDQHEMNDRIKKSRAEIAGMHKHYNDKIDSMRKQLEHEDSGRRQVEAINRHLRNLVHYDRHVDPDQDIDGRIVSVADTLRTVEIDLGHADAAFVGLQLEVLFPYELIGRNPSDAEVALSLLLQERCRIEVISVDSENRSQAKVLPGANARSLQIGAAVATPLWERGQRQTVALLEDVDNADLIKQTLWEAGLETIELADGANNPQLINAQTRNAVVADFDRMLESDNEKVLRDYANAIALARTFAVPVLDVKRLLTRHPIPEPDSEKALQLLERFQERRQEELQKKKSQQK